ncbi:MAG: FtsX-like permease family protein [Gemmatimonadota bacterium]
MSRVLGRASRRWVLRHPWQIGLSALGVALGVAVVLAVDLAIGSARRAFTLSSESVAGHATHEIVGGSGGVPDSVFPRVASLPGVVAAAPVVAADVVADSAALRLLGVDPFSEAPFRPYLARGPGGPTSALLMRPGAALVSLATARRLGVTEGDTLRLESGGRPGQVWIAGVLDPADALSRQALDGLLVTDIATAQDLAGERRLNRIELELGQPRGEGADGGQGRGPASAEARQARDGAGAGTEVEARVRAVLGPGLELRSAGSGTASMREMTSAFDLNLRALGLLALVFGVFLIYNSMTFSVVQRRQLIGTLRVLGVTRGEVFRMVAGESAVLGVVGTAAGLILGLVLANLLLGMVARTINDLYFAVQVRELSLPAPALAKAVLLGVGGTLVAGLPAALEATQARPRNTLMRSQLEARLHAALPWLSGGGVALAGLGGLVLWLSGRDLTGSFTGLFGIIFGCALLIPAVTLGLMRLLKPAAGRLFGILGRMAAGGVANGLSRTAPAIAALTIAVAVAVGVGVMIESFRGTVVRWLDHTLLADIYVSAPGPARGGPGGALEPAAVAAIEQAPGVRRIRRYRTTTVLYGDDRAMVTLMAIDPDSLVREAFDILEGNLATFWPAFRAGRMVAASESFAYRHRLHPGDHVRLWTPAGPRTFPVGVVYRGYGSDQGRLMMARPAYVGLWHDSTVTSVGAFVQPGASVKDVVDGIRRATAPSQHLFVRSNRALRDASMQVFDRTFAITAVLRLLALIVAFVGVVSALMALQLEKARELGVLRANGLTPRQVWQLVASQSGLMGFAAGLMSIPIGLLLAALMIFVVNRRSFGWTIDMAPAPGILAQALGLAVLAALLAGLYPSWRMARTPPAEALREGL